MNSLHVQKSGLLMFPLHTSGGRHLILTQHFLNCLLYLKTCLYSSIFPAPTLKLLQIASRTQHARINDTRFFSIVEKVPESEKENRHQCIIMRAVGQLIGWKNDNNFN